MSTNLTRLSALGAFAAMWAGTAANAATVNAVLTNVNGNTWDASFTVGASAGQPVEAFSVYFDWVQVSNILVQATPGSWDSIAIQADGGLASDGYFDALAMGSGIAGGASLGGFTARFDWAELAGPTLLTYTINDPINFSATESGNVNITLGGTTPVPEPASWALVVLGLFATAVACKARR